MNSGSLGFLIKQGFRNVWLNRVMSLASIGILTACLIILGGAGLLAVNLSSAYSSIEQQNEIEVFIADEATPAEIDALGNKLRAMDYVTEVTFIDKAAALEALRAMYESSRGESPDYLISRIEEDNFLPESYKVKLEGFAYMAEVQKAAEQLPGVQSVSAPTALADTMTGIKKTAIVLGGIIIGILLIASIVVINNTIKLTVFSRRREINIMRYVGATNAFIRMPFKVEGVTIGFIAATTSFGVIFAIYQSLEIMLLGSNTEWVRWLSGSLIPFASLWYWILGGFLIGGTAIGLFASSAAMRKHLKV